MGATDDPAPAIHLAERRASNEGETVRDASRPNGQPRRFLDVTRARDPMGFQARVPLDEGLAWTIESFQATAASPS